MNYTHKAFREEGSEDKEHRKEHNRKSVDRVAYMNLAGNTVFANVFDHDREVGERGYIADSPSKAETVIELLMNGGIPEKQRDCLEKSLFLAKVGITTDLGVSMTTGHNGRRTPNLHRNGNKKTGRMGYLVKARVLGTLSERELAEILALPLDARRKQCKRIYRTWKESNW